MRLTLGQRRALHGYLFIGIWAIGFISFQAWPLIQSFWVTFNQIDMYNNFQMSFSGLSNYIEIFVDDVLFLPSLGRVLLEMLTDVPVIMVFALFAAFLVNQKIPGRWIFRAIFFLPVIVASGMVINHLYGQLQSAGATLGSAQVVGISVPGMIKMYLPPDLAETLTAILDRLTRVLWRSGIQILLFLAGLQGISSSYYEAAKCDGATDWEILWKVTIPMLSPIILVNLIYSIVDSLTDQANELLELIYQIGFESPHYFRPIGLDLDFSATMGWLYFLAIFIILMIVMASSKRWVFYSGERDS
jgi:ABC-type sugar transport system permease subunit